MTVLYSLAGKKIWVTGHSGLVGTALCKRLENENCTILTVTHRELDLTRQDRTEKWIANNKPDVIIMAAATVGGLHANNSRPAEFIYNNLTIESNVIHGAYVNNVEKLLFIGSNCAYPKHAEQPIMESSLLSGPLEPTNEWFSVAKIAGVKMCQAYRRQYNVDFISTMPANLYGPNDNFNLAECHVIPALIQRIHKAKINGDAHVEIWGSGRPVREFMFIHDFADAVIHLMENYSAEEHINIGPSDSVTIRELAETISTIIKYKGRLDFNTEKPDGMMKKSLNSQKFHHTGWSSKTNLKQGLIETYQWFLSNSPDPVM